MKPIHFCTAIFLLTVASAFAQDSAPIPKHLELARELVATVKPENNKYAYNVVQGVRWKGDLFTSENTVKTHCPGFVDAVLERAGSHALQDIKSGTNWKHHVNVLNYAEAADKGYGLTALKSVNEVRAGDLFMFICNDACTTPEGAARGHIAFVDGAPQKRKSTPPIIEGTTQWDLYVIDSAPNPHGGGDTRATKPGEPKISGVGRGVFRIYTDANGIPVGFNKGFGAGFHPIAIRPITFARPKP